jgi:spore coat polysaccharide biosynthesis predicted glycosyltransferase SpsG
LGIEWALLRKPFIEASVKHRDKTNSSDTSHIAVSFGGADPYHFTDKVIAMLHAENNIERIDAIVGQKYQENTNHSSLPDVFFHRSVSAQEVADIFSNCDLAILSASTICMEALACHARVAAGYYADNQMDFYKYLINNKFIYGLGYLFNHNFNLPDFSGSLSSIKISHYNTIEERYNQILSSL